MDILYVLASPMIALLNKLTLRLSNKSLDLFVRQIGIMKRHQEEPVLSWNEWPQLMLYGRIMARNEISPALAWWWVKFLQGDLTRAA